MKIFGDFLPGNWSPVPRPLSNMADKPHDEEECPEKLLSQRVEKANELLNRCDNLRKTIEGLPKLRRKLSAELKFLTSVSNHGVIYPAYLLYHKPTMKISV